MGNPNNEAPNTQGEAIVVELQKALTAHEAGLFFGSGYGELWVDGRCVTHFKENDGKLAAVPCCSECGLGPSDCECDPVIA